VEALRGGGRGVGRRRWALSLATAAVLSVALVGADLARPADRQLTARAALTGIRWYQVHISPHLGARCRFTPTCSVYARTVIQRHGALEGGWMAVKRIARCGPWTKAGTVDRPM
jgi:uncharacterized protein